MDPLTALSLAGNVIQFIDFGSKLFSQGCELYKSTEGRLSVDDEIRLVTAELRSLVNRIRSSNAANPTTPSSLTSVNAGAESGLEQICCEAAKIAENILTKLEHRKLDSNRNRKLESFRVVWLRIWTQSELDALLGRLSRLKDAINTGTLAKILRNTNEINVRTLAHLKKSDQEAQLILKSVLQSTQATSQEIMAAVAQLTSRMDMFKIEDQQRTRASNMPNQRADLAVLSLDGETRSEEVFTLSQWDEKKLRTFIYSRILYHLSYETMPKRYESVAEAHPKTFEWAFQDSASSGLSCTNLSTWLKSEYGLYWISGKPGSGKSTLMKHMFDDSRTKIYLERWAQQDRTPSAPLIIASFFFWNSGTPEQMSQTGMLRSLLFQVFDQKPELLPIVLPTLWLRQYSKILAEGSHVVWAESWTLSLLLTAFRRLTTQTEVPCKLFFLVDGLDEFDGDHEVLAELFNDIAQTLVPNNKSSVKVCVSSRPYVVFQESFEGCPMLKLQDLTFYDIKLFVSERFLGNSAFKRLALREPQATSQLIEAVVSKAGGVFLWVFIVVKNLLRGIRNRDTIPDLWRRLNTLPPELEPLYFRIMSQIEPIYLTWASKAFQLIRAARQVIIPKAFNVKNDTAEQGFLTLAELYFALDDSLDSETVERMTQEELDDTCRETEYHINARCACLLEVTKQRRTSESQIQYLHRTAKDFIEESSRWATVLDHTRTISFDPYWCMMRSKSLMLHRRFMTDNDPERRIEQGVFITILALGVRIDPHGPFQGLKMIALDDAENLLVKHKIDLSNRVDFTKWHKRVPIDCIPQSIRSSFLSCALAMNFSDYVAARLLALNIHNSNAGKIAATHMLLGGVSRYGGTPASDLPTISMKMATTLIQQGADLNYVVEKGYSDTIWTNLLVIQVRDPWSGKRTPIDPEFPRLMNVALSFGADPRLNIALDVLPQPGTLDAYVDLFMRPNYPAEADNIVDTMQQVKFSQSRHKKPVMDTSINIANFQQSTTNGVVVVKPKKRHWWKRVVS